MAFFDSVRNVVRRAADNVNRFWSGADFWDREENRRQREKFAAVDRARDALRPPDSGKNPLFPGAGGTSNQGNLANRLTSGEIKRQQEQQRIQQARREPTQQQQPSFLEGLLEGAKTRTKDIATDLAKDPFTAVSPLASLLKNEITRPARQTDQKAQRASNEIQKVKQDVDRQVQEATGRENLDSFISELSQQRDQLTPEGKKHLLNLLKVKKEIAGAEQQQSQSALEAINQASDPATYLESALELAREFTTKSAARIAKETGDNPLTRAIDRSQDTEIGRVLFGSQPIDKASEDAQKLFKDIPVLRDLTSNKAGALGIGIGINLPFLGGIGKTPKLGSVSTKLSKNLAKLDDVGDIVKAVENDADFIKVFRNLDDSLKTKLLDDIAKETKPLKVRELINKARDLDQTVKFSDNIVRTAKTSDNADDFLRSLPDDTIEALRAADKNKAATPDVSALVRALDGGADDAAEEVFQNLKQTADNIPIKTDELKIADEAFDETSKTIEELATQSPEELARLDDLAKQAGFTGGVDEAVRTFTEPKAVSNIDEATQTGAATPNQAVAPTKAPETPPTELPKAPEKTPTLDERVREVAKITGTEIGEASNKRTLASKAIETLSGGRATNARKVSIRALVDAISNKATIKSEKAITGKGSKTLGGARSLFAGTGLTGETRQIARKFSGQTANVGDLIRKSWTKYDDAIESVGKGAREKLELALRDKKYIKRVYGEDVGKIPLDDLDPKLQKVADEATKVNKITNDLNLELGIIDKKQWARGAEGEHIARIFDIPKGEKQALRDQVRSMFDNSASFSRKDIDNFSDEVIEMLEKDPIRAIFLRNEMALRNKSFIDALDVYKQRGFIQKTKPNKGFIKLEGNRFGKYKDQYMERGVLEQLTGNRMFSNQVADSFDKFITSAKTSKLGKADRIQKAFKTTIAPGTLTGNLFSNPLMFQPGAGTNPLTQIVDMVGAARKMSKGMADGDVYLARQLGVIGGDTGRILTGTASETLGVGKKTGGILSRFLGGAGRFYGNIDDVAKLGLFNRLRKKGLDATEAALEVAKFSQDYNNVGRTISLIADTPVLGKPFARFSPELVRIIKNNATRAPHRMIAGIAALAYINNQLSITGKIKGFGKDLLNIGPEGGETEEERKAREEQVGQTIIPGTAWINELMGGPARDVSLNIPVGDSALNVARGMGLNFPIEPGSDANTALLEQLLPVEIPFRRNSLGQVQFDPTRVVTSLTLRPIIEQLLDQNFMGRPVSDPTNVIYDSQGNVKKFTDPSLKENVSNRAKSAFTSLAPFGNEIDSLFSAFTGRKTSLGKERTRGEALVRLFGIKATTNTKEEREKRLSTYEFFEGEAERVNEFLTKNPDLEQLFFDVYPKTKDRETGKKISPQISPEKWRRINSDQSGRLFRFIRDQEKKSIEQSKKENKRNSKNPIKPLDPIYELNDKKADIVRELRGRYTGDDREREQMLRANTDWYEGYEAKERKYYNKLSKYFDRLKKNGVNVDSATNDRVKKYNNIKYPQQPPIVKEYYRRKNKNEDKAKEWLATKDDSAVSKQFEQDSRARWRWTNARRKVEGAPPISWEEWDNVTFGFNPDEEAVAKKLYFKNKDKGGSYYDKRYSSKARSGKGRSGRGSSKSSKEPKLPLAQLTSFISGLGSEIPDVSKNIKAPKVRLNIPSPAPSRAKRIRIKFR